MMSKTVRKVKNQIQGTLPPAIKKLNRRVAAYARVSTDSEQQQTSIEAQKDYYVKMIAFRLDWCFAGLYVDDGISGTRIEHRDSFNQMVQDALDGKIDLIVTKSISRFARNTVDSLSTIRKLKDHNVEVFSRKKTSGPLIASVS
jgi:DNA invertase Pin-like site-specific DNA recombinase